MNENVFLEESILILDSYYFELKYYQNKLKILQKHKPFFFQFNKKKKYQNEIIKINNKIKTCEKKIKKYIDNQ